MAFEINLLNYLLITKLLVSVVFSANHRWQNTTAGLKFIIRLRFRHWLGSNTFLVLEDRCINTGVNHLHKVVINAE